MQHCALQVHHLSPKNNTGCTRVLLQIMSLDFRERTGMQDNFDEISLEDEDLEDVTALSSQMAPPFEMERYTTTFHVDILKLSDPNAARLLSVEARNATHVIVLCGPPEPSQHNRVRAFSCTRFLNNVLSAGLRQ